MTNLEKKMQGIVVFMMDWARAQDRWIASEPGSDEDAKAKEDKELYASLAHRRCVKLGLNPVHVIGTPACQDANEYDRQIMKRAEAERAA